MPVARTLVGFSFVALIGAFAPAARAQTTVVTAPAAAAAAGRTSTAVIGSWNLGDGIARMRDTHPLLTAARAAVGAARGDAVDAGLWQNPGLQLWSTPGLINGTYARGGYTQVYLTQFLDLTNTPGARRRAAELLIEAARHDFEAVELGLALEVEAKAIALAAAKLRRNVLEAAVRNLTEAVQQVEARVAAGAAPRYDRARIRIALATTAADFAESEADVAAARGELFAAVGPGAATLGGDPAVDLEDAPPLPSENDLLAALADKRPDLQSLRATARSADAGVEVARRNVWPGMTVLVGGAWGQAPGMWEGTASLQIPLPVVDRGQGSIPAARARAEGATAAADALALPTQALVTARRAEVVRRRAAAQAYAATGVSAGDEMLAEARAGYQQSVTGDRFSVLELADAFNAWKEARLTEIELLGAARTAEIDLGRALGRSLRTLSP